MSYSKRCEPLQAFSRTLESGKFVVTAELNPPKGTDLRPLFESADLLRGWVDALNLTDSAGANMAMSPIAAAHVLRERGIEPIVQFTGRDRNRIALEADMLAASALGVTNLLCMSGDPPGGGDHPEAIGVFDLRAETLLEAARDLNAGADTHGNRLSGATTLFAGAVVNPGADDVERELARMEDKARLGAAFFQTQGVYDPAAFESFMSSAGRFGVPVLAGVIVLKSARMARFLNARLPGVHVPQPLIDEMEAAADPGAAGVEIAARHIRELRGMCRGVHVMAIGWEARIPAILGAAGLSPSSQPSPIQEEGALERAWTEGGGL